MAGDIVQTGRRVSESRLLRVVLTVLALACAGLLLLLRLLVVFSEALAQGWAAYWDALSEPDALAALRLTLIVAAIAVPLGVGARMRVSQQYWSCPVRGVRRREWKSASPPGSCG